MKTKILAMKDYHPALGELDRGGDLDWASEKLGGPDVESELEALKKGLEQDRLRPGDLLFPGDVAHGKALT